MNVRLKHYIKESLPIEKELLYLFRNQSNLVFFDIGACNGEDSIRYCNLLPSITVYAFESIPENINLIKENLKYFGLNQRVKCFNYAVSDENCIIHFYRYVNEKLIHQNRVPNGWKTASSSMLKPSKIAEIYPWIKLDSIIEASAKRLDDLIKTKEILCPNFLHIDVQGAELKVLYGLGKYIKKVSLIWVEVENIELYQNQPLKKEIVEYLNNQSFSLIKDTSRGKKTGDCLFINTKERKVYLWLKIRYNFQKFKDFVFTPCIVFKQNLRNFI